MKRAFFTATGLKAQLAALRSSLTFRYNPVWRSSLLFRYSLVLLGAIALFFPAPASAQFTQEWKGVCISEGVATIQGLQCLVGNVLQVATAGIGLIGFIMILVGGFKLLLSGDSTKGFDEAKKTIVFAVAGLIIALSAYFIINIIAQFTGVNVILNFKIPNSEVNF